MKLLVTGCAGFIGSNLVDRLIKENYKVVGIDNFNNYYDPSIKIENLKKASKSKSFKLYKEDILNYDGIEKILKNEKPEKIIHLAARAGVRPSIFDPNLYAEVNVLGTLNLLKLSVEFGIVNFIFASSSSVYGQSKNIPFKEDNICQNIISPYGSTKRSAELFIESFYNSFKLKALIFRLFTVYGPRGRADMAPAIFSKAILEGKTIKKFGEGKTMRDYTFIDDIIDGIMLGMNKDLDFEIINLGNSQPVSLNKFISILEGITKKRALFEAVETQTGDVEKTWADISKAKKLLEWKPKVTLRQGLSKYLKWLTSNNF